jgi:hypothetical protein
LFATQQTHKRFKALIYSGLLLCVHSTPYGRLRLPFWHESHGF